MDYKLGEHLVAYKRVYPHKGLGCPGSVGNRSHFVTGDSMRTKYQGAGGFRVQFCKHHQGCLFVWNLCHPGTDFGRPDRETNFPKSNSPQAVIGSTGPHIPLPRPCCPGSPRTQCPMNPCTKPEAAAEALERLRGDSWRWY